MGRASAMPLIARPCITNSSQPQNIRNLLQWRVLRRTGARALGVPNLAFCFRRVFFHAMAQHSFAATIA